MCLLFFLAAGLIKRGAKTHPCFSFTQCAYFMGRRPLLNNETASPTESASILSWPLVYAFTQQLGVGGGKKERISIKKNIINQSQ